MTEWEWALWQAAYRESPWGEERADLGVGIIASTLANCHRAKDAKTFRPVDFMPYAQPDTDAQQPSAITAVDALASLGI